MNIFLRQISSKNSKLFVESEIWYKDEYENFDYKEFNGSAHFKLKIVTLFGKFGPKNRNCQFNLKIGA